MENDYIKIYLDMEAFFCGEEGDDMTYEETGRLLSACFDYVRTGEDHIDDYFEKGTQGRMAWRAIRRHLDACRAKSEINAGNARGPRKGKKNGTAPTTEQICMNLDNADEQTDTTNSKSRQITTEPQQIETNKNEIERPQTKENPHTHTNTQEQAKTQTQKQRQNARAREDASASAAAPATAATSAATVPAGSVNTAAGWSQALQMALTLGVTDGRGGLNGFTADIQRVAADATPAWAQAALEQCRTQHACTWAYFAAILKGYQTFGGIDTGETRAQNLRNAPRKATERDYDQRPNTEPDGDAVPMFLQDMVASMAEGRTA